MNRREIEDAIRKEVEHWPGVTVEFAEGGKHPKAKFWFNGQMLARPFPGSPGDAAFGLHGCLGDMRRIIKQLGATRDKPEPSKEEDEAPYRKPNGGADARPHPVEGEKAKPKATLAEQLAKVATANPEANSLAMPKPVRTELLASAAAIGEGIYFRLPMEVYRNVPRLGAGSLCDLNKSPGDFWAGSWLDPDRADPEEEEDDKKWKVVGEAYHCARLEPDLFEERFCRKPCREDFAERAAAHGACWNGTDIGDRLGAMGHTKKAAGESVTDQAERLEGTGWEGVIWPLEVARFEQGLNGRKQLEAKVWDEIVRDMDRLRGAKDVAALLTDGFAEVSVFWTDENNIQRKARFDWLSVDHWCDFKTFDNSRAKRLMQAINEAIRWNRYYLTAASYFDAAEAIRTGRVQVAGEPTDAERELVARLQIKPEHLACWFIFQQKSGVPNLIAYEFPFFDVPESIENSWDTGASEEAQARGHDATRRPTQIYQKGIAEVMYAKKLFALYSQVYGPGEAWAPLEQVVRGSDMDFNPHWLEGRYE